MIEQYPQISDIHFWAQFPGRALSLVTAEWITSRRKSYPDCVRRLPRPCDLSGAHAPQFARESFATDCAVATNSPEAS
ncbi:MAG: hypothetical protein CM15mP74_08960 [Halieaceae bacterium]|nr:MAG: hypothetical protein CM15mP74_08960 [Halieaceae bacterium]